MTGLRDLRGEPPRKLVARAVARSGPETKRDALESCQIRLFKLVFQFCKTG